VLFLLLDLSVHKKVILVKHKKGMLTFS
jgi:hypothetical protein